MKLSSFLYFARFGIRSVLLKKQEPIIGSLILTDRCNLSCKHCSVGNKASVIYLYEQILSEMRILYDMGIRVLFFYGGKPFVAE